MASSHARFTKHVEFGGYIDGRSVCPSVHVCMLCRLAYKLINARFKVDATTGIYDTLNSLIGGPYLPMVAQSLGSNCTYYDEPQNSRDGDTSISAFPPLPHHIQTVGPVEAVYLINTCTCIYNIRTQ